MEEKLIANILNFKWPNSAPKIYLTVEETENSVPIHKSKFSYQIKQLFTAKELEGKKEIYTTFTTPSPNAKILKINLTDSRELSIYRQFLKQQLRNYFKEKEGVIVTKNFVRNLQVWLPTKKDISKEHKLYQNK